MVAKRPMGNQPASSLSVPEVVPFEAGHREGVRALLTSAYGSAAGFERLETGNPLGTFLGVCAVRAGRVVGFNIWNPWLVHTPKGPIAVHQSGSSIVDESCRGQGVFGRLLAVGEAEAQARGIKYFIGFPNPASHGSFVRAGWETIRSMSLLACAVPALALRPAARKLERASTPEWQFIEWRYARAGASALDASVGRERFTVFYSTTTRRGLKVHRILDVLDGSGRRDLRKVGQLTAQLPGPGGAYLRASAAQSASLPALPWVMPMRRTWDTPFIVKVLDRANPAEADAVRSAVLSYGDIDVG